MTTCLGATAGASPEIVVLGDVNVDVIAHYSEFPARQQDAFADSIEVHCGGSAANTAMALARLGFRVRLIARLGRDAWAPFVLRCLRVAGVLLDAIQRDPSAHTGLIYVVVTPGGERTMLSSRGANVFTDPARIRKHLLCASHVHLSGYALLAEPQRSAALSAWALARQNGLSLSLDPGLAPAQGPDVRSLLPTTDLLLPTLAEAQALTGQVTPEACAQALLEAGVQRLGVKLGASGCLVASCEGTSRIPAFPIEARDSTGAGDCFDAGLLAGLLGGLDLQSAAMLANAMGALATAQVGADLAGLTAETVRVFLEVRRNSARSPDVAHALERATRFAAERAQVLLSNQERAMKGTRQ